MMTGAGNMLIARAIAEYISRLSIGQGRYAGQPFPLFTWERQFIREAFVQPDDGPVDDAAQQQDHVG